MNNEKANLRPNSLLLWFDFMQNVTLPIANVELGDMFYGTDRMGATVFGVVLVHRGPGDAEPRTKNLIILTDVIDHGSLCASLLLEHTKAFVDGWENLDYLAMWADCGPHFRSYPFLGQAYTLWFQKMTRCRVRFNFFVEKHGKGLVDSVFSTVRGWITTKQLEKGFIAKTLLDLAKVLEEGARRAQLLDPRGPSYHIVRVSPRDEEKPAGVYTLRADGFQISRTYCLEIRPSQTGRSPPVWVNAFYSDLCERAEEKLSGVSVDKAPLPRGDVSRWRRGYYSSTRWDRAAPEQGEKFTLLTRWEWQSNHKPPAPHRRQTAWERKAAAQVVHLARRRARQLRLTEARAARVAEAEGDQDHGGSDLDSRSGEGDSESYSSSGSSSSESSAEP